MGLPLDTHSAGMKTLAPLATIRSNRVPSPAHLWAVKVRAPDLSPCFWIRGSIAIRYPNELISNAVRLQALKRYSIRTLLLATLLIAVCIAVPLRRARMQRQAREWVSAQRGHSLFQYGYGRDTQWYETDSELVVPDILIRAFGIDAFNPVTAVIFDCDELTTLDPLVGMVSLRNLHVNIEMADEIDFTPLAELPKLQSIHFTEWSFLNDSQLAELRVLLPRVRIVSDAHSDTDANGP